MRDKLTTIGVSFATAMATVVLMTAVQAVADSNPDKDQVGKLIPYQGTLEKDGKPFNGGVELVFRLYDGASAKSPVWEETLSTTVYSGRFSVLLGSSSGSKEQKLGEVLTDADDVYLAVSVKTGDETVPLSNRQRFLPVPYSFWTTSSTDLKVSSVDSHGSNQMCLNCGNKRPVALGGTLTIRGYDLSFAPWDSNARGNGGRALVHNDNDKLIVNYGNDFDGGVAVNGPVEITSPGLKIVGSENSGAAAALRIESADGQVMLLDGNEIESKPGEHLWLNNENKATVKTGGDFVAGGSISSKYISDRFNGDKTKNVAGGRSWGSWQSWTNCDEGFYVCGLQQRVESSQGSGDDTAVNDIAIRCCKF